jgi:hypothetical protein
VTSRKARKQARRRVVAPKSEVSDSLLVMEGAATQARQLLREVVQETAPHSPQFGRYQQLVDRGLESIQEFCAGKITHDEFSKRLEIFPKLFRVPPAPPGFPLEWTRALLEYMRRVQSQDDKAPDELLTWLKQALARPPGRPPDPRVHSVGQDAAKLHAKNKKLTWGQIAHRLCPLRGRDHRCTQKCVDRIYQAAKNFK